MPERERIDVGIIGAGSASSALVRELADSELDVVVFEPGLVGGECPFHACIPSKTLLHDARAGRTWEVAVERRNEMIHHLDDSGHAEDLVEHGARLVRARAEILDASTVRADDSEYAVEHLVVATGAIPIVPEIEGGDQCAEAIWTSDDALTADARPTSMVVIGGGVIGMECASLFAGFGTDVTLVDNADRTMPEAPEAVSAILVDTLRELGVDVRHGADASSIRLADDNADPGVVVTLSDDTEVSAERVLVAMGRRPSIAGFGLEQLGVDPDEGLLLEPNGKLRVDGSVWAVGDVAGQGQYTHLANHQASVVADHLAGSATRRFGDAAVPRCMFTDPPLVQVGPDWADLRDDPDVVGAAAELDVVPRASTDELGPGHLWIAARRSTGCVVAATGVGPRFDEVLHALVVAIDGQVPVARLRRSMQPFPTIGEILGPIFDELHTGLSS